MSLSDVISALSLLVAGVSAMATIKFNKRQEKFEETNKKLNEILIEKEKKKKYYK